MVAGLVAERICPGVKEYLLSSHKGKEPAINLLTKELSLKPVIDAGLALGEGTGSVMLFSLLDMAMCIYDNQTSFQDIEVKEYQRFV
jgi:nicotinate-nucleotide--dimethylbenzimidazole phosphoribosyltransferase